MRPGRRHDAVAALAIESESVFHRHIDVACDRFAQQAAGAEEAGSYGRFRNARDTPPSLPHSSLPPRAR